MGPPSVLSGLFSYSPAVERAPKQQTSIGTAVHAGHLPPLDIEKMLGISASLNAPVRGDARTVSSATGLPYVASNLRALLSQSIHDITQNRLRLTDIIGNAVSDLCGFEDVSLVVVGPTPQASMIRQALEDSQISVSINGRIEVSTKVPRLRAGSESVAIVGMSGRFPGSDNIEDFWKNLQDGFDAHTKVSQPIQSQPLIAYLGSRHSSKGTSVSL